MKSETFFYILTIAGMLGLFVTIFYFETNEGAELIEPIDYSERFDRIEAGITNSAIDFCFRWGGQWVSDQNGITVSDFEISVGNGLFSKGQAIYCVKQKPQA